MKKLILLVVLAFVGVQAHAQLVGGAGYLHTIETTSGGGSSESVHFNGFYVGASYNIGLLPGLGVAPGFYVNMLLRNESSSAGGSAAGLSLQGNYREVALNLPVNLTYSYDITPNVALRLFAGPTFQYGIISKTTVSGTVNVSIFGMHFNYTDGSQVNHYDAEHGTRNPFKIYLGGGAGVQVGDILFTVGYDHNLLDVDKLQGGKTGRNCIKAGVNFVF